MLLSLFFFLLTISDLRLIRRRLLPAARLLVAGSRQGPPDCWLVDLLVGWLVG